MCWLDVSSVEIQHHLLSDTNLVQQNVHVGSVCFAEKGETLFRLIQCKRKILFRLKNNVKNTDYKTSEQSYGIRMHACSQVAGSSRTATTDSISQNTRLLAVC